MDKLVRIAGRMCPSAQPEMRDARVLGVVGGTAEAPLLDGARVGTHGRRGGGRSQAARAARSFVAKRVARTFTFVCPGS